MILILRGTLSTVGDRSFGGRHDGKTLSTVGGFESLFNFAVNLQWVYTAYRPSVEPPPLPWIDTLNLKESGSTVSWAAYDRLSPIGNLTTICNPAPFTPSSPLTNPALSSARICLHPPRRRCMDLRLRPRHRPLAGMRSPLPTLEQHGSLRRLGAQSHLCQDWREY